MADDLDNVFSPESALVEDEGGANPVATQPEVVVEPELGAEPEAQPEPVSEPESEPRETRVPLEGYLTERERRQAAERERDQLRERLAQVPARDDPDPLDDPKGFASAIRSELRLEMSESLAREKHGDETVEAANKWAHERVASGDPSIAIAFAQQRNPVEWLVQQHKRDGLLSDIGDNADEWFAREAAKRGYVAQSATAAAIPVAVAPKQASPPARVPRSLASQGTAPSDIRETATGPLAGVDALFG